METCQWCGRGFVDGDVVALVDGEPTHEHCVDAAIAGNADVSWVAAMHFGPPLSKRVDAVEEGAADEGGSVGARVVCVVEVRRAGVRLS